MTRADNKAVWRIAVHTNPSTDCHYLPVVRAIDEIIDGLEALKTRFIEEWESTYVESASLETYIKVETESVPIGFHETEQGECVTVGEPESKSGKKSNFPPEQYMHSNDPRYNCK